MELNALEKEQRALSSDKAGEVEYIQSLQDRINVLKVSMLTAPLLIVLLFCFRLLTCFIMNICQLVLY